MRILSETLGYYIAEREGIGYSGIDVYNTLRKAIRDFEKEKYLLVKPPYLKFTYWCNKCGWFVIDYMDEYDINSKCGYCGGGLQYANKKFIRHTSRLLKKYLVRVKPLILELHRILGDFRDYVVSDYSRIYLEINNEDIGALDIWIYPHRLNGKFTMYILIAVYRLNENRFDIVDELENIIHEYGLNGDLWIVNTPERLSSLTTKGYREYIVFDSFSYSKRVISKYLI